MPETETSDEQLDAYAAEVRAAFERMLADAEIARAVNPSSTALDDVELVRALLVEYAGRIVELEAVLRGIGTKAHEALALVRQHPRTLAEICEAATRAVEGSANG